MLSTAGEAIGGQPIPASHVNNLVLDTIGASAKSPLKQGVVQGAVNATTGVPAFLQVGSGLAVNLLAAATALVLSFSNGAAVSDATLAADVTGAWSALPASQTVYLAVDYNGGTPTYGWTLVNPVVQSYAPSTGAGVTAPGGGTAANAIDANGATKLTSSSTSAVITFFQRDFGAYATVTQLQANNLFFNGTSSTFVFETSLDGTTWTTFGSAFSVATVSGTNYTQSGSAYCRFYRLRMTAISGTGTAQLDDIVETKGAFTGAIWWYDPIQGVQKYWNGVSAWTTQPRVFVGYAVTGVACVTSVTAWAIGSVIVPGHFIAPGGPGFMVEARAGQLISNGSTTKLTFNTVQHDAGTWDATNNRFNVVQKGRYLVHGLVNNDLTGVSYFLLKNGAYFLLDKFGSPAPWGRPANTQAAINMVAVLELLPGDYLEMYLSNGSGSTTQVMHATFGIARVG